MIRVEIFPLFVKPRLFQKIRMILLIAFKLYLGPFLIIRHKIGVDDKKFRRQPLPYFQKDDTHFHPPQIV